MPSPRNSGEPTFEKPTENVFFFILGIPSMIVKYFFNHYFLMNMVYFLLTIIYYGVIFFSYFYCKLVWDALSYEAENKRNK